MGQCSMGVIGFQKVGQVEVLRGPVASITPIHHSDDFDQQTWALLSTSELNCPAINLPHYLSTQVNI